MLKKFVVVLWALALVRAQIPNLGWCPEYVPMANFDMEKFLGVWFEAERFFQFSEINSRCVMANYTKDTERQFRVSNEITNKLTGIKRVLEGEIKLSSLKAEEGKLHVKYSFLPIALESQYLVLQTDYKSYAVLWSCTRLGFIHAENAWIMTRQRIPPAEVIQEAYGVLDKYTIRKNYLVKTDQDDCATVAALPSTPAIQKPESDKPVEEVIENQQSRFADIIRDSSNVAGDTRNTEIREKETSEEAKTGPQALSEIAAETSAAQTVKAAEATSAKAKEMIPPTTVPKLILKVANQAKNVVEEAIENMEQAPKKIDKELGKISDIEKIVA